MTGPTHKRYSVSFVCIAMIITYMLGWTTKRFDTRVPNYYIALIIMLPISKIGAKFPDWDHDWENIGDKNAVSFAVNKLIHLTGGKHRSWQTHSADIVFWLTVASIIIPERLGENGILSVTNEKMVQVTLLAFMSGWISHMIADMMNGVGIRLFCWNRFRIKFVPKKIFRFRFNTGEEWEDFNYFVAGKINIVLGFIALTFPFGEKVYPVVGQMFQNIIQIVKTYL